MEEEYDSLFFIFLTRNCKQGEICDRITIRKNGNLFKCVYKEHGAKTKQAFQTDMNSVVVCYVKNIIELISIDDDPFENIQFSVPGYPPIVLCIENLNSEKINKVLRVVEHALSASFISNVSQ